MSDSQKKGYWIAHVRVEDPEAYQAYVEGARAAFVDAGATFLARGGAAEEMEGGAGRTRHVVIEFPSYQAALDCWRSDTYQAARAFRLPVSDGSVTIVEGL